MYEILSSTKVYQQGSRRKPDFPKEKEHTMFKIEGASSHTRLEAQKPYNQKYFLENVEGSFKMENRAWSKKLIRMKTKSCHYNIPYLVHAQCEGEPMTVQHVGQSKKNGKG